MFVPALLMRMSSDSRSANIRLRSSAFVTSAEMSAADPRATRMTFAPNRASSSAMARPMPAVAPVTRAVLFSRVHFIALSEFIPARGRGDLSVHGGRSWPVRRQSAKRSRVCARDKLLNLLAQHIAQVFGDPLDLRLVLPFHH